MNDLQKLIDKVIDKAIVGCDTYKYNGSTWLLFTDYKKWVIELTKDGTLWYNYNFFKNLFKVLSLDVVENQHYITKWVEDNVINRVKEAIPMEEWVNSEKIVDKTIQNGVKETYRDAERHPKTVEDIIQNGVKNTKLGLNSTLFPVEDVIKNGVKHTEKSLQIDGSCVIEDVIKEGVKHTEYGDWLDGDERFDDIIENGVKETHDDVYHHTGRIEGVIKNGVKETKSIDYSNNTEFIVNGVISRGTSI